MTDAASIGGAELAALVRRVFAPGPRERALAILCDLPDALRADHPAWADRRALAAEWRDALDAVRGEAGLDRVTLVLYRNVRANNADLPETAVVHEVGPLPRTADELPDAHESFLDLLATHALVLAPTELSTTAPLKVLAKRLGFRAATMPGFSRAMVPALRLDWEEVDRRCRALKERLDPATGARLVFDVGGARHELFIDLRHRVSTASGGLVREPGVAANLPSGETYIVPYEGERAGDPSRTKGELPLELEGELMTLVIEGNRVRDVRGDGPLAAREREAFAREPAYANVAELGLGVLHELGIKPAGSVLLDEKLGPHVAFGRSDHFGGTVGPKDFSSPERVIHIDRVYIPETQPRVRVAAIELESSDGSRQLLWPDDQRSRPTG